MNFSSSILQIIFLFLPFISYILMKFGVVFLAGLFASASAASIGLDDVDIDLGSCKVQSKVEADQFSCPCKGGSGNYDWKFYDLPQGWSFDKDKIVAPKGRCQDRKIYGTKIEIVDKDTKKMVKKSLFFRFNQGRVDRIVDDQFNFDINQFLSGIRQKYLNKSVLANSGALKKFSKFNRVQALFDDVQGIGGGVGLTKLRPYFLGKGFYKDQSNPFIVNLPTDEQVDKLIQKGDSTQIRSMIVNAGKSKVGCKQSNNFVEKALKKFRNKVGHFKDEVDNVKKGHKKLQEQLLFLQKKLKQCEDEGLNAKNILQQIKALRDNVAQQKLLKAAVESEIAENSNKMQIIQRDLSKQKEQSQADKQSNAQNEKRIDKITDQINNLQVKLQVLKQQRSGLIGKRQQFNKRQAQYQARVSGIKEQFEAKKAKIGQLTNNMKKIIDDIEATKVKVVNLQKTVKMDIDDQAKQMRQKIKNIQDDLNAMKKHLDDKQAVYKDFSGNYDDFAKIKDSGFNSCHKVLFRIDKDLYKQDNEDGVEFDGLDNFDKYTERIFGKGFKKGRVLNNSNDKLKMKRYHIFSPDWVKSYDSPYNSVNDVGVGSTFQDNDFKCGDVVPEATNLSEQGNSFKGRIRSISKNIAKVVNDKNEECSVVLGGCTRIQSLKKRIPQPGDEVFWRGAKRPDQQNAFNVDHFTCF